MIEASSPCASRFKVLPLAACEDMAFAGDHVVNRLTNLTSLTLARWEGTGPSSRATTTARLSQASAPSKTATPIAPGPMWTPITGPSCATTTASVGTPVATANRPARSAPSAAEVA